MLKIEYLNATNLRIRTTPDIEMELQDAFCFKIPGYRYMRSYRAGWDGTKKLFNRATKQIYTGLLTSVLQFAKDRDYPVQLDKSRFLPSDLTIDEVKQFLDTLKIPEKFERRDYQVEAIHSALRTGRRTMLSPTSSGKSFMIYSLCRWYMNEGKKIMIIVPTTSLVHQMTQDFTDYGYDGECHKIFSGQEKDTDLPITVTTWQSIQKMDDDWYEQFDVVICDEVHGAKAKVLTTIMEKCLGADVRIGFTGTLDGTDVNKLVVEGLFGPVKQVTEAVKLMEGGYLSTLKIKSIVLKYPDEFRKAFIGKRPTYAEEMDFICTNKRRNHLIGSLAKKLEGNTLILFQYVEKQGKPLYELIKELVGDSRPVYFVYGEVDGEIRNDIRKEIEVAENAIIVASYQTFSTGINIKRLHNLILASPTKSRIRLLQSVGRILRKGENKDSATLFDIADNLSWKSKKNYTLIHFLDRVKIYVSEKFNYTVNNVEFKG